MGIEDEDRAALKMLLSIQAGTVIDEHQYLALIRARVALADLIETRERIARRLRRDEVDFSLIHQST